VTSFSICLNEELKDRKISVVSLNPGGVSTGFTAGAGLPDIDKDNAHMLVTPDYIARAVLRAIRRPRSLVIPLRSGVVGRALIWLVPRTVLAKFAGMTYRRYL
jgi:short-subunit dehydrogenase